jgi:predicted nucleotidyltransferase
VREIEINWSHNQQFVTDLAANGVRFFVTGSTALRFHVPNARNPKDLDLMVDP